MSQGTSVPASNLFERWWNGVTEALADRNAKRRAERDQRVQSRAEARMRRRSPSQLLTSDLVEVRDASRAIARSQPVLFNRLSAAYVHGQQILTGRDEARLRAMIEQAVTTAGDAPNSHVKLSPQDVAALKDTASRAERTLRLRESERARVRYALGLLIGVAMAIGVLAAVMVAGWMIPSLWRESTGTGASEASVSGEVVALRDALVAIGAGAVGACLSVLTRLHRMKTVTIQSAWHAAIVRIALGMLFGVGILCLIKGGILVGLFDDPTAQLYDDSTEKPDALYISSWFFWAAVGFIAGFNERWATSLFSRDADANGTAERSEQGAS